MRRYWPLVFLCAVSACQSPPDPRSTNFTVDKGGVKAQYDPRSGRLKRLEVDLDKNGKIDSWTSMDGTRIDLIEIDRNEDGRIERWEHYSAGTLASVGSSTRGDGVEDEWAYQGAGGLLQRIETDTDRDGRIDKWQVFEPSPSPGAPPFLRSVSLDPRHTGHATERMLYRADGSFEKSEDLVSAGR